MAAGSVQEWQAIIERFLQDHLRRAGADGVVLGVSGGLDSAVVAALCLDVLEPDRVIPVLMPAADSDPKDEADGRRLCKHLGLEPLLRPVGPIVAGLEATVDGMDARVLGNAKARARMMVLYAEAQKRGYLVSGTGNKSELLIGYFTKHGDGGNDMQPIGDLYKTQVRELGRHLGLPTWMVDKPPSAGLWAGQTDEQELGMSYDELDAILKGIELNRPLRAIAARTGIPRPDVDRIAAMVRASEHKRRPSLVPKIGARTVGIDWRRSVHWDS